MFSDPKNHPQYQYWRDKVELRNKTLLAAGEQMPLPELRHQCTNYDSLLRTREFQKLDGPDRVAAYHALHYTATLKPLKHREYQLAEQRNILLEKKVKFERAQRELRSLLEQKALTQTQIQHYSEKLKAANQKLTDQANALEQENLELKAENIQLREECDRIQQEYEEAVEKIQKLEKELGNEKEHRVRLAKNNKSMGGRIGGYITSYKKQKAISERLQKEVWSLKGKLQKIERYADDNNDPELREMTQF